MIRLRVFLIVSTCLCWTFALQASEQIEPAFIASSVGLHASPNSVDAFPRVAEKAAIGPAFDLAQARVGAGDQLAVLQAWNLSGQLPMRTGVSRPLPLAEPFLLEADSIPTEPDGAPLAHGFISRTDSGQLAWGTTIRVESAYRLRLHLTDVHVPPGTRFLVYGGEDSVVFDLDLLGPEGDLWTPSVGGENLSLDIVFPTESPPTGDFYSFSMKEVMEIFQLDAEGRPRVGVVNDEVGECLLDATCVGSEILDVVDAYRSAVAQLSFIQNGAAFDCTGALLNDTETTSNIPYLLTANHCISTQAVASTLEAFWDYRSFTCGGPPPSKSTRPRSNGGTLLATGAGSDFALLRLAGVPANRVFLGWTTQTVPDGTILHRISHPMGVAQAYSRSRLRNSGLPTCSSAPRSRYLYAEMLDGGTLGGSSGAPVILAGGFVVGQLKGGCGPNPADGCDYSNSEMDGAFTTTFPAIQAWLQPTSTTEQCVPDDNTLCLDDQPGDRRFEVRMSFENSQASGAAKSLPLSSLGVTRGGLFWIGNRANPEMLVKVLNGCPVNDKYWVFYAATTNQGLVTTVRDTRSGETWRRTNSQGVAAPPIQDTSAFGCG